MHVRSTTGFYGAEKVLLNLLPDMNNHSKEFSASLFTIEGAGKDSERLAKSLKSHPVKVFSSPSQKKIDVLLIKKLHQIIKNDQYRIIHTHDYKSLVHARLAVIGTGAKIVHHLHGVLNTTGAEKIYAKIENFFINFVSAIFVVSRGIRPSPFLKPALGMSFIPNGVELPSHKLKQKETTKIKMLIVARVSSEKNHLLAIDVLDVLKRRKVDVFLDVIGDGPMLVEVKERVSMLGLDDSVKFHGFVTNPESFYRESDILIICSKTEGLPMNLLEALSYGVPVVSTPVGEVPEIIENGHCGYIAEDNSEDFADKLEMLMADKKRFEMMRINALNTIRDGYSVHAQADLVFGQYRRILTHYQMI